MKPIDIGNFDLDLGHKMEDGKTPLYLMVDEPTQVLWYNVKLGHEDEQSLVGRNCQILHVISRPMKGEIRGYCYFEDRLILRRPAYPELWDELDREVERITGKKVEL